MEAYFKYIRDEIDIRVNSLIKQVLEMGEELKKKVKAMEKEALE
jgi:hypothetical protein